jgi:hypothetical protein
MRAPVRRSAKIQSDGRCVCCLATNAVPQRLVAVIQRLFDEGIEADGRFVPVEPHGLAHVIVRITES